MNGEEWARAHARLHAAEADGDEIIDALLRDAKDDSSAAAVQFWRQALTLASSDSTRAGAALLLAGAADGADQETVDLLVENYRAAADTRRGIYLATQFLSAISILAERNALAASEMRGLLLRMKADAPEFILIRAAKLVGSSEPDDTLRRKLDEWEDSEEPSVRGEVLFQQARLALKDALNADDLGDLAERLRERRTAFHRAEMTEEVRDDARLYVALVELLIALPAIMGGGTVNAAEMRNRCADLEEIAFGPGISWRGMETRSEEIVRYRVLSVARALSRISESLSEYETWIRFDESLVELASLYLVLERGEGSLPLSTVDPLRDVADPFALTIFGPLLDRAVSRVRFAEVIHRYVTVNGEDEIAIALRTLSDAASAVEFVGPAALTKGQWDATFQAAPLSPETLSFFLSRIPGARELYGKAVPESFSNPDALRDLMPPLPIDNPDCLGNDPDVDTVARRVFNEARERLAPAFSRQVWGRFQQVVVRLVQCALALLDDAPPFTRCTEDGGEGRNANERHLQNHLFDQLRSHFGRSQVDDEPRRVAGGRVDLRVRFQECEIPIEVKAEYDNIERGHIRSAYLKQADDYATARQCVACLMILDVREINSGSHRERRTLRRRQTAATQDSAPIPSSGEPIKLYGITDSFWIDGLDADPQISNAQLNAVLVGLFPANRSLPSSTSRYSQRR